jgi:S1-C subfamily serine protease
MMIKTILFRAIAGTLFLLCSIGSNAQDQTVPAGQFILKPNAIENPAPDFDGVAIPRKPLISSMRHFEQLSLITKGTDVQLRGVGVDLYTRLVDGVVVVYGSDMFGSGAVVDRTGLIVTNWHVVENDSTVGVRFRQSSDGIRDTGAYVGDVIRKFEQTDLALIRIRKPPTDLTVLPLGNMHGVKVASEVHAIGHPDDKYWTYTKGVVSQIRDKYQWAYGNDSSHEATVIQTQTPINPGSSGGPLFSNEGELIGINSFGYPDYEGINFAVSVKNVRALLSGDYPEPMKLTTLPEPLERYSSMQRDMNENGIPDIYGFDTDNNGQNDLYAVDENEDGVADWWILDQNENGERDGGIFDATEFYPDTSGMIWLFDTDEDDDPEIAGFDYDSDGRIDEYVPWN